MAIRRQLRSSEGLVGYALDADLVHGVFWTVSAWHIQEALDRFAGGEPHLTLIMSIRPVMARTIFTFWRHPGDEIPVTWDLARAKLARIVQLALECDCGRLDDGRWCGPRPLSGGGGVRGGCAERREGCLGRSEAATIVVIAGWVC